MAVTILDSLATHTNPVGSAAVASASISSSAAPGAATTRVPTGEVSVGEAAGRTVRGSTDGQGSGVPTASRWSTAGRARLTRGPTIVSSSPGPDCRATFPR